MRLLDLFCGAGGAAMGYHRAGFTEIVGVDIEQQPTYNLKWKFVQMDALEYLDQLIRYPSQFIEFDLIHASPPCQAYSALGSRYERSRHPDLVGPTRDLLKACGLPFVIENVPGAPLINPIQLCGSSFGLGVRRHRLFETSFPLMAPPCNHASQPAKYDIYEHGRWFKSPVVRVFGKGGGKGNEHWPEAMGIDWMTRDELAQAIPPAYTQFIGEQLIAQLERAS